MALRVCLSLLLDLSTITKGGESEPFSLDGRDPRRAHARVARSRPSPREKGYFSCVCIVFLSAYQPSLSMRSKREFGPDKARNSSAVAGRARQRFFYFGEGGCSKGCGRMEIFFSSGNSADELEDCFLGLTRGVT